MYKVRTNYGKHMKSLRPEGLIPLLEQTKGSEYEFFDGYMPMTYEKFSKIVLWSTGNFLIYAKLQTMLFDRLDFIDYGRKKEKERTL